MSTAERLAVYRESERNNAERIRGRFLKMQKLSNDVRVVIEAYGRDFFVSAQEYAPGFPIREEVGEDGWRTTQRRSAPTLAGAMREFDSMVLGEQRFVESRRR